MATAYLPLINPGDYETFRGILNEDMPSTYDEWAQLHAKMLTDLLRQGESYREIQINPDELRRFCTRRKTSASYQLLRDLAVEKGGRNP